MGRRQLSISKYHVSAASINLCNVEKLYDARSLFRYFKFLFEIKRIQIISSCSQDTQNNITKSIFSHLSFNLNISSRAFYLLYWIFDNIFITMKYADIESLFKLPKEKYYKLSRIFWLCGIIMFLIYCVKTLRKTYTDESDLKVAALNKMTVK
jgi:hypothetical protein